jgi:hypothetical protein
MAEDMQRGGLRQDVFRDGSFRRTGLSSGLYQRYQADYTQYPEREAVFDCWPLSFHKTDKVRNIRSV